MDGAWGFINSEGEVVIEPRFDYAFPFRNGFTVVREGDYRTGKRAFMNERGELLTDFVFDRAYHFHNGFGNGVIDGQWLFVAPDGSSPGLRRYDAITVFEEGHAGVRTDSDEGRLWGLINEAGELVLPLGYERLRYAGEGYWWVGRSYSEYALYQPGEPAPEEFPYSGYRNFTDGYAAISIPDGSDERHELINERREVVFQSSGEIYGFSEGIIVRRGAGGREYVRLDGTPVTDELFYSARPFTDGVATVSVGTSWRDQKWGILDRDGRFVTPTRYSYLYEFNEEGIARYRVDDLFGFVTREGRELTPPRWDNTGEFSDGLCPVLRDGNWGYIDTSGELVIPLQYDYAWDFGNGYAVVRYGDRETGERLYINRDGEPLTGDRFDWAYNFQAGLAHIAEGEFESGMFGYLNDDGEVVWEPTH